MENFSKAPKIDKKTDDLSKGSSLLSLQIKEQSNASNLIINADSLGQTEQID